LVAENGPDALLEDLVAKGSVKVNLHAQEISGAAFSPDGKLFTVGSYMGYARVWERGAWQQPVTLGGYLLAVGSVAFSGDGKRLATSASEPALKLWDTQGVKLWDTESWQEVLTLEAKGSESSSTSFSPDGNVIGIGPMNPQAQVGAVQLWRAPSWAEINAADAAEQKGQHP
jgi:WD40 repeat protein